MIGRNVDGLCHMLIGFDVYYMLAIPRQSDKLNRQNPIGWNGVLLLRLSMVCINMTVIPTIGL